MKTINCAVDSGYGYAIGRSFEEVVLISNFISKISETNAKALAKNIKEPNADELIIKYHSEYYVVGKLATKAFPSLKRTVMNERVDNKEHLIEILSVLGLLCSDTTFNANLIGGLPNILSHEKDAMATWLKKAYRFSYLCQSGEKTKCINVQNVIVVEQPTAVIFNLNSEELDSLSVISLDIGHGTADACLMVEGVLVLDLKYIIRIEGCKRIYSQLEERLLEKYRESYGVHSILERDLQNAIENGVFKINNENKDITKILEEILSDYATYVANEVSEKYQEHIRSCEYLIGAGGLFKNKYFVTELSNRLSKYRVQLALFDDPQMSVVDGMLNIINAYHKDDYSDFKIEETATTEEE